MKKTYIYFFCLILSISAPQLQAQNCWSPLGSSTYNCVIVSIGSYNNDLIVAGVFDSIGGKAAFNIAAWDGSSWSSLGTGLTINPSHSITLAWVSSLVVYNGELYAAGQFDTAGGVPVHNIAKWNGTSWSSVGTGILGNSYTVLALAIYNGKLYAAGKFDTAGGNAVNNIAKWDGTQWSDVDGGLSISEGVSCLTTYNGLLYASGGFYKSGNAGIQNIAVWNDTIWSALGNGIGGYHDIVGCCAFFQGTLYATVSQSNAFSDSLVTWDGTVWTKNINVINTNNNYGIEVLFVFDGNLIAGGAFDSIGTVATSNIAQWDGTLWAPFGGGIGPYFGAVNALQTFNGHLYAGGEFTQAGSDSINSIAEYTCATDGIREVSADLVHVYPNPSTGMINISIDNTEAGASVQIYDLLEQKIFQSNISSSNTSINLSGHAAGSYFYHISGAGGEDISSGTLVIE